MLQRADYDLRGWEGVMSNVPMDRVCRLLLRWKWALAVRLLRCPDFRSMA